ncbi:hypothetical protein JCM6882_008596 [Rhodosporidiobolus microsporus]
MQPYKFPRSGGSLDLTDPSSIPPPQPQPEPPSHPSLLITDSSGHASLLPEPSASLSDADYLAKFTTATNTLLSSSSSAPSPGAFNPGHLSVNTLPGVPASKTLSRISEASEYSVSAYSSNTRDSSPFGGLAPSTPSHSAAPSRSPSPAPSPIDPAFPHHAPPASFSFPTPPQHAHLPPPVVSVLPGSPKRHHLPSRPLTTPLPVLNPSPVPVPRDNFARPPGQERAGSPSTPYGGEVMVQLPNRAPVVAAPQQPHAAYHHPKDSESSSAWATAEDEKFGSESVAGGAAKAGVFFPGDGYDGASLSGASSQNRFTLDADDRMRRERAPGGGWEEEGGKRGNKRVWIALCVIAVIAIAVGVGVGVSSKKSSEASKEKAAAAASSAALSSSPSSSSTAAPTSSSSASSSSLQSVIRPTNTRAAGAVETFSTTFAFSRSGTSTVVPLTYTIPTSYDTRANGQWQFTQEVVLPAIASGSRATGSFTSDLRFRVQPTSTASGTGAAAATATGRSVTVEKRGVREEMLDERRRWERSLAEGAGEAEAVRRHVEGARRRKRMIR